MGSTSAENDTAPRTAHDRGVGRRDLIKRSAALGLIAVPTMSFLSACASGGGGDEQQGREGQEDRERTRSASTKGAKLDVVIFDGGFGDAVRQGRRGRSTRRSTRRPRSSTPPPRRSPASSSRGSTRATRRTSSTTPAPSRWTWTSCWQEDQLADLTPLLDAPSIDDPGKKVRDTLSPGIVEMGQFDGDRSWILYYAYTVYGVWYSGKLFKEHGWRVPQDLGRDARRLREGQEEGHRGLDLRGQVPVLHQLRAHPT